MFWKIANDEESKDEKDKGSLFVFNVCGSQVKPYPLIAEASFFSACRGISNVKVRQFTSKESSVLKQKIIDQIDIPVLYLHNRSMIFMQILKLFNQNSFFVCDGSLLRNLGHYGHLIFTPFETVIWYYITLLLYYPLERDILYCIWIFLLNLLLCGFQKFTMW